MYFLGTTASVPTPSAWQVIGRMRQMACPMDIAVTQGLSQKTTLITKNQQQQSTKASYTGAFLTAIATEFLLWAYCRGFCRGENPYNI